MSSDDVEAALSNLEAIKNGDTPEGVSNGNADTTNDNETTDRLEMARNEVDRLYEEHDLDEHLDRENLHVAITQWSRKHGVCKYHNRLDGKARFGKRMSSLPRATGEHVIAINETLEDDHAFIDTTRHELAHAIAYAVYGSNQKHNPNWKQWAQELGAEPSACSNKSKDNDSHKYYLVCLDCGYEWGRTRLCKTIKRPWLYSCGSCNSSRMSSYEAGDDVPEEAGVAAISKLN